MCAQVGRKSWTSSRIVVERRRRCPVHRHGAQGVELGPQEPTGSTAAGRISAACWPVEETERIVGLDAGQHTLAGRHEYVVFDGQ